MKLESSVTETESEFSETNEEGSCIELTKFTDEVFPKRKREVKEDRKFIMNNHWKDPEIK